jgi:prepilin-type N-terminal cleavage/methylation domain-containing protein
MENVKWIDAKGFTLIEVMAVISTVGLLMGIAVLSVSRIIENSRVEV